MMYCPNRPMQVPMTLDHKNHKILSQCLFQSYQLRPQQCFLCRLEGEYLNIDDMYQEVPNIPVQGIHCHIDQEDLMSFRSAKLSHNYGKNNFHMIQLFDIVQSIPFGPCRKELHLKGKSHLRTESKEKNYARSIGSRCIGPKTYLNYKLYLSQISIHIKIKFELKQEGKQVQKYQFQSNKAFSNFSTFFLTRGSQRCLYQDLLDSYFLMNITLERSIR